LFSAKNLNFFHITLALISVSFLVVLHILIWAKTEKQWLSINRKVGIEAIRDQVAILSLQLWQVTVSLARINLVVLNYKKRWICKEKYLTRVWKIFNRSLENI
jgi:hypothetical protein